jgi:K+ potassium transporter
LLGTTHSSGGRHGAQMLVWRRGTAAVQELADEMQLPVDDLVAQIATGDVRRVPGTGVLVARLTRDVPPILFWYLRHIRSLHESTVIVNVVIALVPYVAGSDGGARDRPAGLAGPSTFRASWSSRIPQSCYSALRRRATRWIPATRPTSFGTRRLCGAEPERMQVAPKRLESRLRVLTMVFRCAAIARPSSSDADPRYSGTCASPATLSQKRQLAPRSVACPVGATSTRE